MSPSDTRIEIVELEKRDLKGATVIDGFPSVGLVSTIAANYIVNTLKLEEIALVESREFPAVSVIREGIPLNPVRIYAGEQVCAKEECNQLVVLISEFSPAPQLINPLVNQVLDWLQEKRCDLLISTEGLSVQNGASEEMESQLEDDQEVDLSTVEADEERNFRTFGVASTPRARRYVEEYDLVPFNHGTVAGVSGVFLTEGAKRNFDVLGILAEAHQDFPDAKAAARIIEVINRLLLQISLDAAPLYKQAEALEAQIKVMRSMAQHHKGKAKSPTLSPSMFG